MWVISIQLSDTTGSFGYILIKRSVLLKKRRVLLLGIVFLPGLCGQGTLGRDSVLFVTSVDWIYLKKHKHPWGDHSGPPLDWARILNQIRNNPEVPE